MINLIFAHAGHGHTNPSSLGHLLEPAHLPLLIAGLAAIIAIAFLCKRGRKLLRAKSF